MELIQGSETSANYNLTRRKYPKENTQYVKYVLRNEVRRLFNGSVTKFMVTPCINNIQHFNFQLTHTTLKSVELLKHFEISKTAPTCFGLQGNHLQGASEYLAKNYTRGCNF